MGERGNNRSRVVVCGLVAIVMVLTVLPSMESPSSVTSNRPGPVSMSSPKSVAVTDNQPPVISIQSSQLVNWKTTTYFSATASDADNDMLRFTWNWGDGTLSVTTTPANVPHVYAQKGHYDLYVYADDLTGLPGHNVSALDEVRVADLGATPPSDVTLSVAPLSVWVGQNVVFTGSARDSGGDAMNFNFTFGDGTYNVIGNGPTAANQVVTDQTTHAYALEGTMTAYMVASDGVSTTQSIDLIITVTLNHPPVVTPQANKIAYAGALVSFSATASDADGETLRYTWNFGDATPLQVGQTTTHTYAKAGRYNFTVYVDDLTGLAGHNVSSTATAQIAFNLALVAAWNFISVPLVGYGYKASTIGLATGDVIIPWNSTTQSYSDPYIKGISPPSKDFPILEGAGYWVWVAAAKTLHLSGSVPTTMQNIAFKLPLSGGWIAVGFLGVNTVYHASDITTMYSGSGAVALVAYYEPPGRYHICVIGILPTDFWLVPGLAYWVWITAGSGGSLSYMPR